MSPPLARSQLRAVYQPLYNEALCFGSESITSATLPLSVREGLRVTRSEPPEASYPVQRHSHVIRNIKTYSTPSLALCPIMGANKLPDFSRQ